MTTLNEYQQQAAKYRTKDTPDIERLLGLVEEAGEVAGVCKRHFRGDYSQGSTVYAENLKKELGDTLWYLSQVAKDNGFSLEEIALTNLEKLEDRFQRGVLKGSGNTR